MAVGLGRKMGECQRRPSGHYKGKQTSGKLAAGSLLMDAPKCKSFDELTNLSGQHGNHEEWDALVNALKKRETRER